MDSFVILPHLKQNTDRSRYTAPGNTLNSRCGQRIGSGPNNGPNRNSFESFGSNETPINSGEEGPKPTIRARAGRALPRLVACPIQPSSTLGH